MKMDRKDELLLLIAVSGEIPVSYTHLDGYKRQNQSGYDGYEVDDEYETVLKPKLSQYLAVLMEETWNEMCIRDSICIGHRYNQHSDAFVNHAFCCSLELF